MKKLVKFLMLSLWRICGRPSRYYIWALEPDIWIRVSSSFFYKLRIGDIVDVSTLYETSIHSEYTYSRYTGTLPRWVRNRRTLKKKMKELEKSQVDSLVYYEISPIYRIEYWPEKTIAVLEYTEP